MKSPARAMANCQLKIAGLEVHGSHVFFKTFVFVIFFSVVAMGEGKSKVQRPPFPFDAGAFGGQGVPPPRRPQPSCVAAPSLRGVTLISGVVAFVVFCVFFPRSLR